MNRSLRKRHARLWLLLWPVLLVGVVLAIKSSVDSPPAITHTNVGDSQ